MTRLTPLTDTTFDVLIIGAGIYGATLACSTARAGLSVALIDKEDYGGKASANSLKILHGGLRYLQQCNLPRMRESILARRDAFIQLPHLTRPAPFLAPTGASFKRSAAAYRIAGMLNDRISYDRNRGVSATHHIPRISVCSPEQLRSRCPALSALAEGALQWTDGFIDNTERYTLAYVMSAREAGAVTANYVAATALLRDKDTVIGASIRDEASGDMGEVRAHVTVNTTGFWQTDLTPSPAPSRHKQAWVRAYNIVTRKQWFGPYGVGFEGSAADGTDGSNQRRHFFFVPWREHTLIGTMYNVIDPTHTPATLVPEDIARFVDDINHLFPSANLRPDDISYAHVGIQPAALDRTGRAQAEPLGRTSEHIDLAAGYIAMEGVKYTTAARYTARLAKEIAAHFGRVNTSDTGQPVYGGERLVAIDDVQAEARKSGWDMDTDMADALVRHAGARYADVLKIGLAHPPFRNRLPGSPLPAAILRYTAESEGAMHLDDVLFRRTDIGTVSLLPTHVLEALSQQMMTICQWHETRRQTEVERIRAHYASLGLTA